MNVTNFLGDLTDISAKKEALLTAGARQTYQEMSGTLLDVQTVRYLTPRENNVLVSVVVVAEVSVRSIAFLFKLDNIFSRYFDL